MAQLMKRLSLNSEGALRTTIHSRIPHNRNSSSATWERENVVMVSHVNTMLIFHHCRKSDDKEMTDCLTCSYISGTLLTCVLTPLPRPNDSIITCWWRRHFIHKNPLCAKTQHLQIFTSFTISSCVHFIAANNWMKY